MDAVEVMPKTTASVSVMLVVLLAVPMVAEPLLALGLDRVATMLSVPSTRESSRAAIVKAKGPVPLPPLKLLSKVRVSKPSKVTPAVAVAALLSAATKFP